MAAHAVPSASLTLSAAFKSELKEFQYISSKKCITGATSLALFAQDTLDQLGIFNESSASNLEKNWAQLTSTIDREKQSYETEARKLSDSFKSISHRIVKGFSLEAFSKDLKKAPWDRSPEVMRAVSIQMIGIFRAFQAAGLVYWQVEIGDFVVEPRQVEGKRSVRVHVTHLEKAYFKEALNGPIVKKQSFGNRDIICQVIHLLCVGLLPTLGYREQLLKQEFRCSCEAMVLWDRRKKFEMVVFFGEKKLLCKIDWGQRFSSQPETQDNLSHPICRYLTVAQKQPATLPKGFNELFKELATKDLAYFNWSTRARGPRLKVPIKWISGELEKGDSNLVESMQKLFTQVASAEKPLEEEAIEKEVTEQIEALKLSARRVSTLALRLFISAYIYSASPPVKQVLAKKVEEYGGKAGDQLAPLLVKILSESAYLQNKIEHESLVHISCNVYPMVGRCIYLSPVGGYIVFPCSHPHAKLKPTVPEPKIINEQFPVRQFSPKGGRKRIERFSGIGMNGQEYILSKIPGGVCPGTQEAVRLSQGVPGLVLELFTQNPDRSVTSLAPFIEGENLDDFVNFLKNRGEIEEFLLYIPSILKQSIQRIAHLHERSIAHRDIKEANIMVERREGSDDKEDEVWVTLMDGDLSHFVEEANVSMPSTPGSLTHAAPELFDRLVSLKDGGQRRFLLKDFFSADIFSIGVIFYQLLSLERLRTSVSGLVKKRVFDEPQQAEQPLAHLVYRMLSPLPYERPSAQEVSLELENKGSEYFFTAFRYFNPQFAIHRT